MAGEVADRRNLRASDSDRDAVVELLHRHAAVGRLDLSELDERISSALSAKTYGELDSVLVDLPLLEISPLAPSPIRRGRRAVFTVLEMVVVDIFFLTIWLMTGHHTPFWPGWLIAFVGLYFARRSLKEQRAAEQLRARSGPSQTGSA